MSLPAGFEAVLGRRGQFPNIADRDSAISVAIAGAMFEILGVDRDMPPGENSGVLLEEGVRTFLAERLPQLDPSRSWNVTRRQLIADYDQYAHLGRLDELVLRDPTLRVEIGRDYLVRPDVTVGLPGPRNREMLHAAVSCKFTIRSDRVQNIRHEGVVLTRHRRGRQPHIVTVTAEPLPSRLASIARGTGEVDGVYHIALGALQDAVQSAGTAQQQAELAEIIGQRRLADLETLARVLAV